MQEIAASRQLQITTAGCIISIAFFNFFGISVTKKLSGASRCTIDACRTLFVWAFSMWAGWENFHTLQVGALSFLVPFLLPKATGSCPEFTQANAAL